jgi:hypothetical protein
MRATDAGAQWRIGGTDTGIDWGHGASDSPPAVRLDGPAAGLFLALVRRRTLQEAGIEIDSDMQVWHTWLARTPLRHEHRERGERRRTVIPPSVRLSQNLPNVAWCVPMARLTSRGLTLGVTVIGRNPGAVPPGPRTCQGHGATDPDSA